jgi:hypothetical protein
MDGRGYVSEIQITSVHYNVAEQPPYSISKPGSSKSKENSSPNLTIALFSSKSK